MAVPAPECPRCKVALTDAESLASICGEVFGDEYIDTFYRCAHCAAYCRESFRDRFSGPNSARMEPLEPRAAEALIELVRRCPSPSDEDCRCEAHREYFMI